MLALGFKGFFGRSGLMNEWMDGDEWGIFPLMFDDSWG